MKLWCKETFDFSTEHVVHLSDDSHLRPQFLKLLSEQFLVLALHLRKRN